MKSRGSLQELLDNLRQPRSLAEKLSQLVQNRLRALVGGGCCGHPGQAGC